MRKTFQNIVLIGYLIHSVIISAKAQSFEEGGIIIGGNMNIHFINNIKYDTRNTDINTDFDIAFLTTDKTFIGFRLNLLLLNEKNDESYTNKNDWISNCYFKTPLFKSIYIEIFGGYGKWYFKHESNSGSHGYSNIHMTQFGTGIGFPKFLSAHIVLNPFISYDHKIMFVKKLEEYNSNQHFNNLVFKVGLYYYFNPKQKTKKNNNSN
ncbi:MAG: hypothetical protein AMS27_16345 [Bacteroides sp. SM23_62_1]|nr:MAG: hypothetical protein AMS27_16345 [Bacteroides sp. SM23_62_1]